MNVDVLLALTALTMVPFAVFSTVVLAYASRDGAQLGALTERTFIALDICVMLVSGAGLTVNRLTGYSLFPIEVGRIIFSVSLIALGFVPMVWVVLWYRGKLGE